MNEDKRKKLAIVRAILCILVIVIVILGWIEIIPKTIGMIISTIILCVASGWNGVEALQMKRKGAGIFNFVICALILALCIITIIF